jgi:uncharacterized membrane protein
MRHKCEIEHGPLVRSFRAALGPLGLFLGLFCLHQPVGRRTSGYARSPVRYAIVPLNPSGIEFEHLVINDHGQIAGNLRGARRRAHACLWRSGKLLRLPELGASMSGVSAINNRGEVVGLVQSDGGIGTADKEHGYARPVLWRGGHARKLTPRGWLGGNARDINDRGEVLCTLWDRRNREGDFLIRHGRARRIGVQKGLVLISADALNNHGVIAGRVAPPGADAFERTVRVCLIKNGRAVCYGPQRDKYYGNDPTDLNDKGMVVGNSSAVEVVTAYTIMDGNYVQLDRDFFCSVSALNNEDQYVGTRCVGNIIQDGPYRAVLWQDGSRYDLNTLVPGGSGWVLEHATGINNRGVIVGTGTYKGHARAFKLIPR